MEPRLHKHKLLIGSSLLKTLSCLTDFLLASGGMLHRAFLYFLYLFSSDVLRVSINTVCHVLEINFICLDVFTKYLFTENSKNRTQLTDLTIHFYGIRPISVHFRKIIDQAFGSPATKYVYDNAEKKNTVLSNLWPMEYKT